MVYSSNFVAAIKVDGKVLRESNGEVVLPFSSEFSVLLKNLNSVKAMAKVFIDGDEVSDGWLVVDPNQSLDLERFIKNGNLSKGNKFKFIERTSQIENHRGIKVDDGLVRVEYKFQKKVVDVPEVHRYRVYEPYYAPRYRYWDYYPWYPYNGQPTSTWTNTLGSIQSNVSGRLGGITANAGLSGQAQNNSAASSRTLHQSGAQNMMRCCNMAEVYDAGITVAGSESNQQFHTVSSFETENQSHVVVLRLKGSIGGTEVKKPVTVKTKQECSTCGKINKSFHKFCMECGTALTIF